MLLIVVRVQLDAVGNLAIRECLHTMSYHPIDRQDAYTIGNERGHLGAKIKNTIGLWDK
jgi:hypothetical protein